MKERTGSKEPTSLDSLSARELEILDLISKGLSNSQIALKINLSLETVKWHNKHLFSKLNVASRSQAVAKAVETGILTTQAVSKLREQDRLAFHLPVINTSFIGREKEIEEVERLVASARLVTITGPGGVGKTRLAIEVARRLNRQFPDGVRWVALAAVNEMAGPQERSLSKTGDESNSQAGHKYGEDLVIQAVAKAIHIPESPDRSLLQDIFEHLYDRQMLFIIDNCEHLIEACASLAEQLQIECPQVSILTTSREAFGVPGEKAWTLPPLSLPDAASPTTTSGKAHTSDYKAIYQSEAVRLFIQRTGDVLPGYQPEEADAPILAAICRRLDGIPLAIELAAARMNMLSLQEILSRLDRQFSLLTGGHRTALPHHQTLRAAIEWSYNLLTACEQALFRRLSIFAGTFPLEAAEFVCAGEDLPGEEVLTLLGQLVEKSLLIVEPAPKGSNFATRYRFLETICNFGRLKLDEANETRMMYTRHADYYVRLVETAEPELNIKNLDYWYRLLQTEYTNIRSVIEREAEYNQPEKTLRLVGALLWFWYRSGLNREGLDLAQKALSLPLENKHTPERGRALNTAGFMQFLFGKTAQSRQSLQMAVSILRASNDEASLAMSLQFLGLVHALVGEYNLADSCMEEGLSIVNRLANVNANAFLFFRGDLELKKGNLEKARSTYEESARILRTIGNKPFLAYPLRRLGYLALEQNDIPKAWKYFKESLDLNLEVRDMPGLTASLLGFALLAIQVGNPVIAARLYGVVENWLETLSVNLLFTDQAEFIKLQKKLTSLLDEFTFTAAFIKGLEMSEEQAVASVKVLYRNV